MGTNRNNDYKNERGEEKYFAESANGTKGFADDDGLEIDPIKFEAYGKTTRVNSYVFAKLIRETLQKKFHDLIGCYIQFDGTNFHTTLFFQNNVNPIESGKIKNLINFQNNKGMVKTGSMLDKMRTVNKKLEGETYTINDATKLLLSDLMYGGANAHKPNNKTWKDFVKELPQQAQQGPYGLYQMGAENIIVSVSGLDIRRICKLIYGSKMVISTEQKSDGGLENTNSNSAFYEVRFAKLMPDGSFMMNIEQFDRAAVDEISKAENPQFAGFSGIRMC